MSVIIRWKWILIACVALVPLAAVLFSLRQQALYQGSAEVLITHQNLASALTGTPDPLAQQSDPVRVAQTQADLARTPAVAAAVVRAAHVQGLTTANFLSDSSVTPKENTDLLEFNVTWPNRSDASSSATEYARQFTVYRRKLDTTSLVRARKEVERNIARLRASGDARSNLHASLVEKEQQLRTAEALQTSNVSLVRPSSDAEQVQPRTLRNGAIALILALLLGVGLVFFRESLDTRVRSAQEISDQLDLPLLGRLEEPTRHLRGSEQLAMVADPHDTQAEAFRMLRTSLELVDLAAAAETIMFTSSMGDEGKTTTVANLGVAFARAGKRALVVDLDMRRPNLHRMFKLPSGPGITDVMAGAAILDEALTEIAIDATEGVGSMSSEARHGSLKLLPCGTPPPDPGELIGTAALSEIIEELRLRADIVLIDSPPLLGASDAMTLSTKVGGLVVLVRLRQARKTALAELARILARTKATKLGFVLTGAGPDESRGYGDKNYILARATPKSFLPR